MRDSAVMNITALLLGLALLTGCTTHPITGREQILALPEIQGIYADMDYALSTIAQDITAPPSCEQDCGSAEDVANFPSRVKTIGTQLTASARDMSPEQFKRIGGFRIEVKESLGVGTGSSASGRIALGSGLARLEPTDTVIAFLIAREMAHVIARHAEENSGASIVFSALGMLVPGINVIVRLVATTLGAGMLKGNWATHQQREADEIALALLERIGLSARSVALGLERGVKQARLPDDEWGARYLESTQRVALIAGPPPRYAEFGNEPAPRADEARDAQPPAAQ